jgi:hypothetical protein
MALGFEKGSVQADGGRFVPIARFTCNDCGTTLDVRIPYGPMNPETMAKKAVKQGWLAHPNRASDARCPACQAARALRAHGDAAPSTQPLTEEAPVAANTNPPAERNPSGAQRLQIRQKLDAVFDDDAGCYLDGYSDQKIGGELNLPWSWVATIREAAYGPIRVDPEVAGMRAEVTALKTELEALSKEFLGKRDALIKKVDSAIARLDVLAGRRKAS